jgi:heme oxygenase
MASRRTAVRSRRFRLRDITLAAHARLDNGISAAGFMESRSAYISYLQARLQARQPIERALDECGAQALFAAWPRRRIAEHLAADIDDLDGDRPSPAAVAAPNCPHPAEILGALYVLEGSALGASLLFKRAQTLGMTATCGARHLQAQTSDPSAWRAFVEVLERQQMTPDEELLCDAAALRTFGAFERELLRPGDSTEARAKRIAVSTPDDASL